MRRTISIGLLVVGLAGCNAQPQKQQVEPAVTSTSRSSQASSESATASQQNQKVYSSQSHGIMFHYSAKLWVEESAKEITVHHAVPFAHPDPCDFKGDGKGLDVLTDFHVVIRRQGANLHDLLKEYFGVKFEGSVPVPEEGYIEKVEYGSLRGYRVTLQNEGCGQYEYYFPFNEKETLVVVRSFISEFIPTTFFFDELRQKYEKLSGAILPSEEESLFNQVLSTLHIL